MKDAVEELDRYVSFCGLDCDGKADTLIAKLEGQLDSGSGGETWCQYFQQKRAEQAKMKRDNLHFIGNQLNPLYEYFEACEDASALELLYQIEQECC